MTSGILNPSSYALNAHAVAPVLVGALIALLGLSVMVREKFSGVSMAFGAVAAGGAMWLFSYGGLYCARDPSLALVWGRIENAAVVFIPSMVYLFSLAVTGRLYAFRVSALTAGVLSGFFAFLVLFTGTFVTGLKRFPWGPYPQYGPASVPFLLFFFGMMVASLILFQQGYCSAPSEAHRRRMKLFLAAFGVAYLASVDYLPTYGIPVYPFGYLAVCAFLVIVARTIWKYQLTDITTAFAANQIVRTMSDALLVLDREGVIRVTNQAACRLFGRSEAELVGSPVWTIRGILFPREKLQTFLRTSVIHGFEVFYAGREGEVTLDVAASGIRDGHGQPAAVVCILRDVTSRRRAEVDLRRTNEQLRRAHQELSLSHEELKAAQLHLLQAAKMESVGRLAAGVAHEVKNPLAVVLQGLDYLEGHLPAPVRDETVTMVLHDGRDAVRRADRVIRGLLDFSAIRDLEMEDQDINTVVDQALLLVRHELDRSQVHVVREFGADLPPVWLDRHRMEQVFVNLAVNAAHAMPRGGMLRVRTTVRRMGERKGDPVRRRTDRFREGDLAVAVEIEDTGEGIPPEILPKIFDPFITSKPRGQGTGLGLTVTKSIVDLHGGVIDIQNRHEGGTRVTLLLRAGGAGKNERA